MEVAVRYIVLAEIINEYVAVTSIKFAAGELEILVMLVTLFKFEALYLESVTV